MRYTNRHFTYLLTYNCVKALKGQSTAGGIINNNIKLCAWRHDIPPPLSSPLGVQAPHALLSKCNVAVLSHAEYIPTLTAAAALHVKAVLSKAAW